MMNPVKGDLMEGDAPFATFDMDHARSRIGGDEGRLRELAEYFLTYSRDLQAAVERARADTDYTALEKAAHKAKGSLDMVGALQASATARRLETLGREAAAGEGNPDLIGELVMDLGQQMDALRQELDRFLKGSA